MLEAQQRAIDKNPRMPFYNLNIDAGALWARRMIDRMLASEQGRGAPCANREPPSRRPVPELIEWRSARLRAARDLSPDIRLFEIEPAGEFVAPTPGSHFNVVVHINGRPDVRYYSAVGPCTDGVYRIAVKRLPDSRGGSAYMWSLAPGAQLTISTPGNHFELSRGRAGISAARRRHRHHADLHHGAGFGRRPEQTSGCSTRAAAAKTWRWPTSCGIGSATACRSSSARRAPRVDLAAEIAASPPTASSMSVVRSACWRTPNAHGSAAAGRSISCASKRSATAAASRPKPFKVKIPRLGREIDVPRNQTMLEALEAAGVDMIFDCRRGECGLCALPIVATDGIVDHRDVFFSDEEKAANTKLCTCVSRVIGGSITIDTADRIG